jgi:hypothetical protein
MTSTYWPIPEFPGGATARAVATGGTAAVIRNAKTRMRTLIFVNIRLTGLWTDSHASRRGMIGES